MKYRPYARQDALPGATTAALAASLAAIGALVAMVGAPRTTHADSPLFATRTVPSTASAPTAPARPTPAAVPTAPAAPTPLTLRRSHGGATFTLTPSTDAGDFDAANLELARQAFAWREDAFRSQHAVSARLLRLVYQTMRHFGATEVELVSGFRDGRATSRHSHGRAIDFAIPGVPVSALAAQTRTLGFVGVGIYPRSGFVHLDIRAMSYFWVDYSHHGRRGRVRQILAAVALRSDAAARARGEAPDAVIAAEEAKEKAAYTSGDPVARVGHTRAARIAARRERVAAERQRLQRRQQRLQREQLRAGRAATDG